MAHTIIHTRTHRVDWLRRGMYQLTIFHVHPSPTAFHVIRWHHGNRRSAFRELEQLFARYGVTPARQP